jgi:hypothetical protein
VTAKSHNESWSQLCRSFLRLMKVYNCGRERVPLPLGSQGDTSTSSRTQERSRGRKGWDRNAFGRRSVAEEFSRVKTRLFSFLAFYLSCSYKSVCTVSSFYAARVLGCCSQSPNTQRRKQQGVRMGKVRELSKGGYCLVHTNRKRGQLVWVLSDPSPGPRSPFVWAGTVCS